jgi:hypothetical protein
VCNGCFGAGVCFAGWVGAQGAGVDGRGADAAALRALGRAVVGGGGAE